MNLNLKSILKAFKLNESTISMVLGAVVIIAVGVLVANYFKGKGPSGSVPSGGSSQAEVNFAKTHTVVKGESLWTIAEKEIGSGYNWVDIAKANNLQNPSLIFENQKLVIPSVEAKIATANPQTTTSNDQTFLSSSSISGATYEVVRGDNLWNIAVRAYGDGYKWVEIAHENKLANPDIIHAGNILALPR